MDEHEYTNWSANYILRFANGISKKLLQGSHIVNIVTELIRLNNVPETGTYCFCYMVQMQVWEQLTEIHFGWHFLGCICVKIA